MMDICPFCGSIDLELLHTNRSGSRSYKCRRCHEWFEIGNKGDNKLPESEPHRFTANCKSHEEVWEETEKRIQHGKIDRFQWQNYLGEPLTKLIARLKAQGMEKEQVYGNIITAYPALTEELKRRLEIGISARFGEIKTAEAAKNGCN
jgi:hypothetical protein